MLLRLTSTNGTKIWINMNLVESMGEVNDNTYILEDRPSYEGMTYLFMNGMKEDDFPYIVKETPEHIAMMVRAERRK